MTALDLIKKISADGVFIKGKDEYRVIQKSGGTRREYVFSCPVFRKGGDEPIELLFNLNRGKYTFSGFDARVFSDGKTIEMKNETAELVITVPKSEFAVKESDNHSIKNLTITPTFNGIKLNVRLRQNDSLSLPIKIMPNTKVNLDKSYAVLSLPNIGAYASINITTLRTRGLTASGELKMRQLGGDYILDIVNDSDCDRHIIAEINLYCPKNILDTTLESVNENSNGTYCDSAFVGADGTRGQQWYYGRLSLDLMEELRINKCKKAVVFFPLLSDGFFSPQAYEVIERWCTITTDWTQKPRAVQSLPNPERIDGFMAQDITHLVVGANNGNYGFVLKGLETAVGFTAFATGDNYFIPPFVQVEY